MPLTPVEATITGTISPVGVVSGSISADSSMTGTITIGGASDLPEYDGSYAITPTDEPITLNTAYRIPVENIIINPVPQNYGHIAWNGSYLSVY